jgi:hypothetical protein
MVYDSRGLWSKIDRFGDGVLRTFEEHHVKQPGKMLMDHPKDFLKSLPFVAEPKRSRGTDQEILENVHRLGLDDYYGPHPWGIEIKKPDLFKKGIALQDIYRQDLIGSDLLNKIDRFGAIAEASQLLNNTHAKYGAVGEFNIYAVLFADHEEDKVTDPVLMLPTIIYNHDKPLEGKEKEAAEISDKATDLLDFLVSIGSEEWRRIEKEENFKNMKKALKLALDNYQDSKVIALAESFAKRGRLSLPGDENIVNKKDLDNKDEFSSTAKASRTIFSAHAVQRFNISKDASAQIRKLVIEACVERLAVEKSERAA